MFHDKFHQNEGRSCNDTQNDEAKWEEEVVKTEGEDRCALVVYVRPEDPSMHQPVVKVVTGVVLMLNYS